MTIDLDDIESRINDGIYGDDRMSDTARDAAFSALAVLLAEVERLRAELGRATSEAYDLGVKSGEGRERAAVVAWLRDNEDAWHMPTWQLADKIERGEHRREEKP